MRVPRVPLAALAVLLLLCLPAPGVPGEGGVDPRVPDGAYADTLPRPVVTVGNHTFEGGGVHDLKVTVSFPNFDRDVDITIILNIYRWGTFGEERDLPGMTEPLPEFVDHIVDVGDGGDPERTWSNLTTVRREDDGVELGPRVTVPEGARKGFYRVRVWIEWTEGDDTVSAKSRGYLTDQGWRDDLERVRDGEVPVGADFLVSEGGFSVVPEHFGYISQPNRVPDLGNFSTPVIRPGETGGYGFLVTNRYDMPMTDVQVTIEFYMWATIEDAEDIDDIEGPPPKVRGEGGPGITIDLGDIEVGGSRPVDIVITTSGDTDKGTYFVRHRIDFGYNGTTFRMDSRGYYTFEQWEGFDYSNLYYQLGVAGIVPDSSFSVKDPVPLWPLATLIALCVLFGVLAVVFYLAEEHGDQYPRLKRGLQTLTGRWEQRKRLLQQRVEELRGEDWQEEEEAEAEGEAEDEAVRDARDHR